MKNSYAKTIALALLMPCVGIAQNIQISSSDPLPPISSPANHEAIGYFNISADTAVHIDECILSFSEGFELIDHIYLHVEELPRLSAGDEFLTDPWNHSPSYFLNMEGEENVSFEYFADIDAGNVPSASISYDITCKVLSFGGGGEFIWTDPVSVSTPVYTSVQNAHKPSGLLISGRYLFIPKRVQAQMYSITGQEVRTFPESLEERREFLDIRPGVYLLVSNGTFAGKIALE